MSDIFTTATRSSCSNRAASGRVPHAEHLIDGRRPFVARNGVVAAEDEDARSRGDGVQVGDDGSDAAEDALGDGEWRAKGFLA